MTPPDPGTWQGRAFILFNLVGTLGLLLFVIAVGRSKQ